MRLILLAAFFASQLGAQTYAEDIPPGHPAIQYLQIPPDDPITHLAKQVESGKVRLDYREGGFGYLPSLLEHLGVNVDSQALVFSKTSFQAPKISPKNPRAVYFNDGAAIGWVRGGDGFELAGLDPRQGIIFYTLSQQKADTPHFVRQDVCLKCHQGPATIGVPGIFIGSVFPDPDGTPTTTDAIVTDHRTAFADRWGGWYVNAKHGEQPDRANSFAGNPAEPDVVQNAGRQNIASLARDFDVTKYLSPVSDIVALMTFEHQTQMVNLMTRVAWEERIAQPARNATIEALLEYMLFVDEVPLKEPIEGVSTFTKTFPQRGPADHQGRSLRDFDLQTRLFRYPLSYMIYSPAFDALPAPVLEQLYRRLHEILADKDTTGKFAKLSAADRTAILEILHDTKPAF